ncbi:hypothetical protein M413DRAFT_440617 [Hebeloma cylindrosporum]|uniref:Uncharacterized protein n=1 Tax=Hebeloma cylindrosporum TaxID=76867 RepID=A0A0C2YB93_HEBCY|nr:hypothetical protein M413DRAFT_440617 [Hebeloma cylindrosporum h7]
MSKGNGRDFTPSTTVAVKSGMIGLPVFSSTTGEIVAVQRRRAIRMKSVSFAK